MSFIPPRLKTAQAKLTKLHETMALCEGNPGMKCLIPGILADIKKTELKIARIEQVLTTNPDGTPRW